MIRTILAIAVPARVNFSLSLIASIAILSFARPASAHVVLDDPNGGESLVGGTNSTVRWHPDVAPHDTLRFELSYSTNSNSGPWTVIANDIPPGNLSVGSVHTYSWLVPNINDPSVWLYIRQVNDVDIDYDDVSNGSFSITAAGLVGDYNHDDSVDAADYTVWRNAFGQPGAPLDADGNNNNQIDEGDYTVWKMHYGETDDGGGGIATVPEPTCGILLLGLFVSVPLRASRSARCR